MSFWPLPESIDALVAQSKRPPIHHLCHNVYQHIKWFADLWKNIHNLLSLSFGNDLSFQCSTTDILLTPRRLLLLSCSTFVDYRPFSWHWQGQISPETPSPAKSVLLSLMPLSCPRERNIPITNSCHVLGTLRLLSSHHKESFISGSGLSPF